MPEPQDPMLTMPVEKTGASKVTADEAKLVGEVNEKYTRWRMDRQPHEIQWFITSAFLRGLQWVSWNEQLSRLEVGEAPSYRIRLVVNHMLPKYKARQSKFLRTRFEPQVIPATSDREDKLNAKATQKALVYILSKEQGERKYRGALNWANTAGKGFWWLYWDKTKRGRVLLPDPLTGVMEPQEAVLGDVCIEVGSPFEILIPDYGASSLADQPELMRVRMRTLDEVKTRYKDVKDIDKLKGDGSQNDLFMYQRQIATLSSRGAGTTQTGDLAGSSGGNEEGKYDYVCVKELFTRPNGKYPKGRYVVVANDRLLLSENELPYNFHDLPNPFPVVEFPDLELAGQFWPVTIAEQMIGIQKEYNLYRSKSAEQVRLQAHPKIIVPVQCQWPENSWTSEPGEVIRILMHPGLPGPQIMQPANIASDIWRLLDISRNEFSEVTNVFPGQVGKSEGERQSGFQVNLLQEAADSVHGPDVRLHELAFEEACLKIRRMMSAGYDIPRLLAVTGKNMTAESLEFSKSQIDEAADIRVFTSSALSSSPAVRNKQILELYDAQLLGPHGDPETIRKATSLLDIGGVGELQEDTKRDEELARRENDAFEQGALINDVLPMPWENHEIHWTTHTDLFKSPEFEAWPEDRKRQAVMHAVLHARFINPARAITLAHELSLEELLPYLQQFVQPPPPPGGNPQPPQPAGPAPQGAPPPAPAPQAPNGTPPQ